MGQKGDRSSRLLAPAGNLPQLSRDEIVRREAENGLRQADRMFEMIEHALAAKKFRLRPSTLIELNRIAVDGLVAAPGALRGGPMVIDNSAHKPPPHEDVPAYVDDLCDYVGEHWEKASPVHLAAYILWRLNWIHPFEDGNGRTSRATSYLVLCVRLGYKLPGARTIPEVISSDKSPYYRALESADAAWRTGTLDSSGMEELLKSCLAAQLLDVVGQATGGRGPSTTHSVVVAEFQAGDATAAAAADVSESLGKPRVFIGSSAEGLPVAEALQVGLEYDAEVTLWSQGVFGLSSGTLETLTEKASAFDFALLVLTPDDMLSTRGDTRPAARDNVLFELGLFMGKFGRFRTFVVHPRGQDMHLPSDLAGITVATYESRRRDGDIQAAVGPVCTKIKRAIRDQGSRNASA